MVMQSLLTAAVWTVAFLPTIVRGSETEMMVVFGLNVPLMTTSDLPFCWARPTPLWRLHTGACKVPLLLSLHVTAPVDPTWIASVSAAQWPSSMQTAGPMPAHSVSRLQARQVLTGVVVEQMGVVLAHWLLPVHWTHWPSLRQAGSAGFLAKHWASDVQAVHVLVDEQMGAAAAHVALVRQPTQALVVVSQTPVAPLQSLLPLHWTQAPVVAHTARVASLRAAHSSLVLQAWHLALLQTGVAPAQLAALVHWTQVFVVVSHAGVAPLHAVLLLH